MKKIKFLSVAILPIAAITTVVSCSNNTSSNTTKTAITAKSPRIALTDPENPRWVQAQEKFLANFDSLNQGAAALLAKTQTEQNAWLDTAISAGTEGLIIGSINGEQLGNQLRAAKNKKIPVVAYDRLIKGTSDYDWYLTYDNSKVGTIQGLSLASSLLGKEGEIFKTAGEAVAYLKQHPLTENKIVLLMGGALSDNNAKLFFNGAMDVINKLINETKNSQFKIMIKGRESVEQVLQNDWDYTEGQNRLSASITALTSDEKLQIRGILAPNDGMAQAAVASLKANGVDAKKVYITGQDFNDYIKPLIKNGEVNMTIYKPDNELSFASIALLNILIAENKKTDGQTKLTTEQIFEQVKTQFETKFSGKTMTLDLEQYKKTDTESVFTILLTPQAVTKANIDSFN
ncbi:substrate-binding domain-containing protein [[Mycoplasma] collis]|uniref:substrate-binding domain-containing protein n=1 Tax=[Mycoplasma] collis TaxID=2127 RepID=UPI00051AD421|nr:substrate-binding domain-containing protein [[Mycoplasma] collis]